MWFENLAEEYKNSTSKQARIIIISEAFLYPHVVHSKIEEYKGGWLGSCGEFARVLARMLSQMD